MAALTGAAAETLGDVAFAAAGCADPAFDGADAAFDMPAGGWGASVACALSGPPGVLREGERLLLRI